MSDITCSGERAAHARETAPHALVHRLLGTLGADNGLNAVPLLRVEPGRWRGVAGSLEIYAAKSRCEGAESVLLARRRAGALEVAAHGDLGEEAARNLADCLVRGLEAGAQRFVLDLGRAARVGRETEAVVQSLRRCLCREAILGEIEVRGGESACWQD